MVVGTLFCLTGLANYRKEVLIRGNITNRFAVLKFRNVEETERGNSKDSLTVVDRLI